MKCSKPRFASRPRVENLESRLQPGSLIIGQGYGWSLLADNLSILNQGSLDSQSLVTQTSAESSKPTTTSTPVDVRSDNLNIAVTSVAAARSQTSSLLNSTLVDNLAAGLTNDLSNLSFTGSSNSVQLAAVETPTSQQTAAATPAVSVPQSPIGVATPASPVVRPTTTTTTGSSGLGHRAVADQAVNVDKATAQAVTGYQRTNALNAASVTLANTLPEPGGAGNQATLNYLSYLGGSGPDSINSVVVRNEGVNFIYVAGSFTDTNGRTDAFAAKLLEGATSAVWQTVLTPTPSTAGPDNATGLAVSSNGVYLTGTLANPAASSGTDGFVAQLNSDTGAVVNSGTLPNATLAAVATDTAGNVYAAGSVPDSMTAGQQDVAFVKLTSDLSTTTYGISLSLTFGTTHTPATYSAVTTGSGLIVDAQGNAYFAGTVGLMGHPSNETFPLYGRVNAAPTPDMALDWGFRLTDQTPSSAPGPGNGTAVAFDPNGNVVFTGSINDGGTAGVPLNQDLALGRADPTTGDLVDLFGGNHVYYIWSVDNRKPPGFARAGDWIGNGLVVLADGSSIVTGAAFDPAAGTNSGDPTSVPSKGIDVHLTHFVVTDNDVTQNLDGDPENIFGGSGTDVGNAVALDPNNPTNVYVVGSTTSTDLPTTSGVVQQTYSGTSTTGFVGQASVM